MASCCQNLLTYSRPNALQCNRHNTACKSQHAAAGHQQHCCQPIPGPLHCSVIDRTQHASHSMQVTACKSQHAADGHQQHCCQNLLTYSRPTALQCDRQNAACKSQHASHSMQVTACKSQHASHSMQVTACSRRAPAALLSANSRPTALQCNRQNTACSRWAPAALLSKAAYHFQAHCIAV